MIANSVSSAFQQWYADLPLYAGLPARGTLAGALVVLERLQETCDFDINAYTTAGGVQIKGTGGPALRNLLAKYGKTRPFLAEGGRTNMGLRADMKALLNKLERTDLKELPFAERKTVVGELQYFLVTKMQVYPIRLGLKAKYNPARSPRLLIHDLLELAHQNGKEGSVAQHLVGAKLQLRFPNLKIGIESVSTADQQLDRASDFLVGTTAFHVTIAPMQPVFDKCKRNLRDGMRVCLLVPEGRLQGARQLAEMNGLIDQIDVESIESYVSTNIAEQSEYDSDRLARGFLRLSDEYNRHVDIAEIDKSLLIEIPANLQRLRSAASGA